MPAQGRKRVLGLGEVVQHFASFVNLTRHIQEASHLRLLLDELNHRTQNTLATVLAIAGQTLRSAVDKAAIDTFEGRILALSKAHSLLGREKWLAVTLRDVIDQILQPFGLWNGGGERFLIAGDDVQLSPKAALTLAMVFHELATNAAKYGALSNGSGKIAVDWSIEPTAQGGWMRLSWQESGGPPVAPPTHKGFGSRLIEGGLAQELQGEVHLDYAAAGVVCRIGMPVPRIGMPAS
jgi:two-component sensor histidine kinase